MFPGHEVFLAKQRETVLGGVTRRHRFTSFTPGPEPQNLPVGQGGGPYRTTGSDHVFAWSAQLGAPLSPGLKDAVGRGNILDRLL